MAAVEGVRIGSEDGPIRRKPQVSELPISSAKRSTVDGLLHVFKKKGEFDSLRKKVYAQFEEGDSKSTLLTSLRAFTDEEIDREPSKYLGKDRRLAAPLLEGAAARADIYPTTEADIDQYISAYLSHAEGVLRVLRQKDIGEDAAREEEAKGAKSDEAYGAEAQVRRSERAKQHIEAMKLKKKKEKAEARKRELEALKQRAMELTKEKEKLERDQKRRAEREAARAKQKAMEEERRKVFAEERDRREKEAAEAARKAEEEKERRRKEKEAADAKHLEQEAMRQLLRDGERLTEKTGRRSSIDRAISPDRRGAIGRGSRLADGPGRNGRSPSPSRGSSRRPSQRDDGDRGTRANSPRRELPPRRDRDSDRPGRRDDGPIRNRSRSPPRRRWRDGSRSPGPRRRDRSWSRSPPPRRAYRQRDYSPPRRRRSRSRSPPDIDRYVPSSSSRRDDRRDRDRDNRRDRDREDRRDRDRDDRRDRDRERDKDRAPRDKDRDRDREQESRRNRDSSRQRDREKEPDRDGEPTKRRDPSGERRRSPAGRPRSKSR